MTQLKKHDTVADKVWAEVRQRIWHQTQDQVKRQIFNQVWEKVQYSVEDQLWGQGKRNQIPYVLEEYNEK